MKHRPRKLLALLVLLATLSGTTACNSPQQGGRDGASPSGTPRSPVRPTP
jgi:hypothetical protein